jgi:hypothetical protein
VAGQWFPLGTPVSSMIKTDHHDVTEILLKMALNTITQTLTYFPFSDKSSYQKEGTSERCNFN